MKKLPLGIQHFDRLREDGCIYVDKMETICRLVEEFPAVFLVRPRRFGKSLLLSTIAQLYKGRKDLFSGLWAEKNWDWEKTHPVIHFYMDKTHFLDKGLARALCDATRDIAEANGLVLTKEFPGDLLEELVVGLRKKTGRRVVVLFDEYDKPIVDMLHQPEEAEQNRKTLSNFYGVLKPIGDHIQFLMFTGISKFSQVSVFSKLNQLEDITFNEGYASLLGYTQMEIEANFEDYLQLAAAKLNLERQELLAQIKHWYNGYTWDWSLKQYVYNPVSVMKFFAQKEFANHWFATGTPGFLIQMLKTQHFYAAEDTVVSDLAFESYTPDTMEANVLLLQTGYLTLRERLEHNFFRLGYPNHEVRAAFLQHLMAIYGALPKTAPGPTVWKLRAAFFQNNLPEAISIINTLFEQIPGNLARKEVEADYHAMLYLVFRYMGLDAEAEVSGLRGRSDAVLKTPTHIYVIEFKLDRTGQAAVDYLRNKGYAEQFRHDGRPVILLGIGFSRKKRGVGSWKQALLGDN